MAKIMEDKEVKQILAAIYDSKPDKFMLVGVMSGDRRNRYFWCKKKSPDYGLADKGVKAGAAVAKAVLGTGASGLSTLESAI